MLHESESPAPARPELPSVSASSTRASIGVLAASAFGAIFAALWLALATWRLDRVPGMSLDEAWSILSARGQWPPHDPLSGMTSYAGPFPVLLLEALGTEHGLLVLRVASLLANGASILLIAALWRRHGPAKRELWWALPLIASCPIWLVVPRTGIEVVMFMPFLALLGLYALTCQRRWAAFVGGLAWGLLVYNHVIGGCFVVAFAAAWRMAYRRWPLLPLAPLLTGAALGVAPRLVALVLYHDQLIDGTARGYSLRAALGDLRWVPVCLWRTLQGDTVYLRYVGRLALRPWPYWSLALAFIWPWLRRARLLPAAAWFALLATLISAFSMTLAAPYIAVRFMLLPVAGCAAFLAISGAAAIERDARWRWPISCVALLLTGLNLFYCSVNFHGPWQRDELGLTRFWLGDRSKRTGNWAYFPKQDLVQALLALQPVPQQILTVPTLERPLRVLLDGSPVRVKLPAQADASLRSVYVDYLEPDLMQPRCEEVPGGRLCFGQPEPVARHFLVYR